MKFDLIIKDLDESQVADITAYFSDSAPFDPPMQKGAVTPVLSGAPTVGPEIEISDEVDATGLPWDERIHSKNKTRTGKNVWQKRKGVQEVTVTAVEQELRTRMKAESLPTGATAYPQPAPYVAPFQPAPYQPPVPQYDAYVPQSAPPVEHVPFMPSTNPPVVYNPPAPPAVPQAPQQVQVQGLPQTQAPATLQGVMIMLQNAIANPSVDPDLAKNIIGYVNQQFGTQIQSITDIATNQGMIDYVHQILQTVNKV